MAIVGNGLLGPLARGGLVWRGKAKAGVMTAENLEQLGEVKSGANRFFLGCVRLRDEGGKLPLSDDGPKPVRDSPPASPSSARACQCSSWARK